MTASYDNTARVSKVLFAGSGADDSEVFAAAAEFAVGYTVNEFGSIVPVDNPQERLHDIWKELNQNPHDDPDTIPWFLRRFLPKETAVSK